MFRTQRMTKVRITGAQNHLSTVISVLHDLKLVHLLDHLKTEELDIGSPLANSEEISSILVKIRSLLSGFSTTHDDVASVSGDLATISARLEEVSSQHDTLQGELAGLKESLEEKKQLLAHLQLLVALQLDCDALRPYSYIGVSIGSVAHVDGLEGALDKVKGSSYTHTTIEGKEYVAVLYPKKDEELVAKILSKHSFTTHTFPDLQNQEGDITEQIRQVRLSLALLEKDQERHVASLEKFELTHVAFLRGAEQYLDVEAEKAQAPLRFGATSRAFFVHGWVSEQEYKKLTASLAKATKKKVFVEVLEADKHEKIPIVMKNMFFVKPFEFFMNLYTLPSYKEMDPSFFMFFTFPFFFGLMLGDVVYGLITFALFGLLWLKFKSARNLLAAMMLCSIVTIFFGFIYGEYLGFEAVGPDTAEWMTSLGIPLHEEVIHGKTVYSFPRLINRLHGHVDIMGNTLPTVLVIGAILGFIHVNLGLFLGFINELGSHGFVHAFLAKISWYVLELGVALAALGGLGLLPLHWGVGMAVMLVSVVMLYFGEGVQGIVEIPAIMTNILSYMRLGAVGLASVGLAVVVNEKLFLPYLEQGGIMLGVAIFVLILGHMVNIALGIIGPFLHSLRLHYVEFFSKFYHGGGVPFQAFGEEKK